MSTRIDDFRRRWSRHDVRTHGSGMKRFHHEAVGHLTLAYESVEMISEPGLTLTLYAAEPGSPIAENLRLLASWAADHRTADHRTAALPDPTAPVNRNTSEQATRRS